MSVNGGIKLLTSIDLPSPRFDKCGHAVGGAYTLPRSRESFEICVAA
jgi:hypothetical protein